MAYSIDYALIVGVIFSYIHWAFICLIAGSIALLIGSLLIRRWFKARLEYTKQTIELYGE